MTLLDWRTRRRDFRADELAVDELVWVWRNACIGAGLSHTVQVASGMTDVVPKVVHVVLGPPVVLTIELLPAQVAADIRAVGARLAGHLGAIALRIEAVGGRHARIELLTIDPLRDVFPLLPLPADLRAGRVLLARDEDGQAVTVDPIDLGHAVVQGSTRAGKSGFCYSVLAQLAKLAAAGYPLTVDGVDPSGILLRPFPGTLTALRDPAEVETYLGDLVAAMDKRIAAIPTDRDVLPVSLEHPLRFTFLEEYPATLRWLDTVDAKIGKRCRGHVLRLLSESHKAGGRLWLVAQRAESHLLGSTERGQAAVKVSFRVDVEGVRLLHPDADLDVAVEHAGAAAGVALLSLPGVDLRRVRGPWIGDYATFINTVTAACRRGEPD